MNFNKQRYLIYKGPDDSGFNTQSYLVEIRQNKLGFKDFDKGAPFIKRSSKLKGIKGLLKRLGLV